MRFASTLLTALLLTPLAGLVDSGTPETTAETWTVSNTVMRVTVSARDAGAVCSLVYDGLEFVNDHDHGRQLQVAWINNDLDEAYNPTEAGADSDGGGPRSSSQLLSVNVEGATLQTQCHPAYWRNLSVPERHRKNTALVTKDLLTKRLTLGHRGDPHVLVFDTTVAISSDFTGPPISSVRIESPTLYSNPKLAWHCLFDPTSGELKDVSSHATMKNQMNEVIRRVTRHDLIPVLSTHDQRQAVAFFTPQRENFWAYYTHDVPSDDPTNACGKITAFFKHPVATGQSYSYRTFIIVGDLATVKASARRLLNRQSETPAPHSKP